MSSPADASGKRPPRRVVLAAVVLTVAFSFAFAEVLLRVALFHGSLASSARIISWVANFYGNDTFYRLCMHVVLREGEDPPVPPNFDPLLGWTASPRTPENPLGVVTSTPYRLEDLAGRRVLLFFGDSFVKGVYGPTNAIPARLGTLLPEITVMNLGVQAYGLDQTYLFLKSVIDRFEHPHVVVGILYNDIDRVAYQVHASVRPYFELEHGQLVERGVPIPADPRAWLRLYPLPFKSYALSAVTGLGRRLAVTKWSTEHLFFLHPSETWVARGKKTAISAAVLRALRDECARREIPLTVVLFPHVEHVVHDGWYASWLHRVLADLGITYIDLSGALRRRVREKHLDWRKNVYTPLGHPSPAENDLFAREIAAFLRQTYGEHL